MVRYNTKLLNELRSVIEQLGDSGGLISPSVYDTAQILRLCPPDEGVGPGIEWLLTQQYADGGWGVPTVPTARDIPTLAALLTLYIHRHRYAVDEVIQNGLGFLQRQAHQWMSVHIDFIPIAGETILPYLLEEAAQVGLVIDHVPYARMFELRRIKLKFLAGKPIRPNSASTFSWEALGFPHMTEILNTRTGVGHSPSATAGWLHAARQVGEDPALCAQAEAYLARAGATTGTGIPGVMPSAYPITGFELCYGLYPLVLTGLMDHPSLQDVVLPQIEELRSRLEQQQGLGFGEDFVPDVDDTAVAVAVLQAAKQSPDIGHVRRFWNRDHFYTYTHELNPSVYSNAHALHALVLCGERCKLTEEFLIEHQKGNGGWDVDKWHTSWRSSTMEVVAALLPLGYEVQLCKAAKALIDDQNPDGSWGLPQGALILETTYSVIALQLLATNPYLTIMVQAALENGQKWLWSHIDDLYTIQRVWLCKEVFSLIRVDKIYKLCALLSPILHSSQPTSGQHAEIFAFVTNTYEASQ